MIRRSTALGARRAFTLVELLIVILLIAVLMAIIVPQFFGAREKAGDRVAQQTLRAAVSSSKVLAQDTERFGTDGADADAVTALTAQEANIAFVDGPAGKVKVANNTSGTGTVDGNQRQVSVNIADRGQTITLAEPGENGACWFVSLHYGADDSGNSRPDEYGLKESAGATCDAGSATLRTSAVVNKGEFPGRN